MSKKLTRLQNDVLCTLFQVERRRTANPEEWNFHRYTQWGRTSYLVARLHDKLSPAPVSGLHNMNRAFEARLNRTVTRLVKLQLCHWRKTRTSRDVARFGEGYRRHRGRARDLFMTESGREMVCRLLQAEGRWAIEGRHACGETAKAKGPIAGGLSGCGD